VGQIYAEGIDKAATVSPFHSENKVRDRKDS
jgi:hypothetical protein